jgi:hypothetical protein
MDVCAVYLRPLCEWLVAHNPTIDEQLCQEAVEQALLTYVSAPGQYDPARADLGRYLRMSAQGDLRNLLRRERRHHRQRISWNAVELGVEAGNMSGRDEEPLVLLERNEESAQRSALLQRVREGCTPVEQRAFDLMVAGERNREAFAVALELTHLGVEEQEDEVKRVKDRLKSRLKREGNHHD